MWRMHFVENAVRKLFARIVCLVYRACLCNQVVIIII